MSSKSIPLSLDELAEKVREAIYEKYDSLEQLGIDLTVEFDVDTTKQTILDDSYGLYMEFTMFDKSHQLGVIVKQRTIKNDQNFVIRFYSYYFSQALRKWVSDNMDKLSQE